jgi:hypothetical protein
MVIVGVLVLMVIFAVVRRPAAPRKSSITPPA